jgi:hypothetical protein
MRRAVISVALILGISIMIMGCQPVAERKPATPQQQNQTNNMQFQDTNNMADRFERLAEQVPGVRDATVFCWMDRRASAGGPTHHLQWLLKLLTKTVGAVFDRQPCLLRYSVGWTGGRPQVAPTNLQRYLRSRSRRLRP